MRGLTRESALKVWEARRKNGTVANTTDQALKAWETRRKNGSKVGGCDTKGALKVWETRRKNGTNKMPDKGKRKLAEYIGEKASMYIDGRTNKNDNWRKYIRDLYKETCCFPGCRNRVGVTKMDPHHILKKDVYPELQYSLNNGCLLCTKHHTGYHAHYKGNINRDTLTEFLLKDIYNEN